jgi:hypothetical protein
MNVLTETAIQPSNFQRILEIFDVEDSTMRKLRAFAELPNGWHFGEGRGSERIALLNAKAVTRNAQLGGWQTDAFPGVSGEIMVSIETSNQYYEVVAEADGTMTFVEESGGNEISRLDKVSLADVIQKLSPANIFPCVTFDLSTPRTGSSQRNASPVWLSETPAKSLEEESLSSNATVLRSEAGPLVRTWETTIRNIFSRSLSGG